MKLSGKFLNKLDKALVFWDLGALDDHYLIVLHGFEPRISGLFI